ncbi:Lrp/AsnC family transcriptional regulator [Sneathiella chinensis]|uniref:AsnC family transcriptional regulator n=1 Tax=Sneathiella chinensis TaxID=349750 RepID=A0ABQ5U2A2_9PROT|nr:Lrp/AsnC family transcriptional regulator [Sneathiella chinensis]GLQ06029.1 AsnC family transcriptional regulator [Sneathiella chinensis]
MKATLDDLDARILNLLQEDSRRAYGDIGRQVGLSTTAVKDRIDKLRDRGVLENFSVSVSVGKAGFDVVAFILVGIDRPADCALFEKQVLAVPEIQECHHVAGAFNYLLKVVTRNLSSLEHLLSTRIKMPDVVSRTETTIVFSSVKSRGMLDCTLALE